MSKTSSRTMPTTANPRPFRVWDNERKEWYRGGYGYRNPKYGTIYTTEAGAKRSLRGRFPNPAGAYPVFPRAEYNDARGSENLYQMTPEQREISQQHSMRVQHWINVGRQAWDAVKSKPFAEIFGPRYEIRYFDEGV